MSTVSEKVHRLDPPVIRSVTSILVSQHIRDTLHRYRPRLKTQRADDLGQSSAGLILFFLANNEVLI